MPQISLYVDDETMATLRADSAREGVSISKHVGNVLKDRQERKGYPDGFFALYGRLAGSDIARPSDETLPGTEPLFA